MSTDSLTARDRREALARRDGLAPVKRDIADRSFTLLRIGFTVLPIVMGADKFANILWDQT